MNGAKICGYGRVVAGLHYPSDYDAGVKLGEELIDYVDMSLKEDAPVNSTGVGISMGTSNCTWKEKEEKRIRHLQTINYGEISKLPCTRNFFRYCNYIAYFSVIGMATIFNGAFLGTVVMMSALEFGKIVTATYLHLFWDRLNYMKYYLTLSVVILMLITSLGIFGYLSKANIETTLVGDSYTLEMSIIDKRIGAKEELN